MLRLPSKLLLLILLISTGAQGAELLVHGNEQAMWIAVVSEAPRGEKGVRTRIRMKAFGGENVWRELRPMNGRVVSLASRGQALAALLDTGDWLLTFPNGESIGPALPTQQKILYLASEKETVYAIAPAGRDRVASSEPSVTTAPASAPADKAGLELFKFETSKWERVASLPGDLPETDRRLRLAVIGGKPLLAVTGKGGVIRVLQLGDAGEWVDRGSIAGKTEPTFFDILNVDSRPAIWVSDATAASQVSFWMGSEFAPPTELTIKKPLDAGSLRDAIYAKGNIREIVLSDIKLFEQCYRPDGSPSSDLTELSAPKNPVSPGPNLPTTLLMVALAVLILASMRRGEPEEPVALQSLSVRLAPLGTRVLAGLIDLSPIFAAGVYLQFKQGDGLTSEDVAWPVLISVGIYLLHTTVLEVLTARSLGKFICGLKVVSVEGGDAKLTALFLRNILRAVDLFPLFPLAIMISFTPLRQRVGDVTARTIVISTREAVKHDDSAEVE
jgi:uncharacterized RDD family membrane protein YckC